MNAPLGKYFAFHSCCRSVSILYIEADDGVFTTFQRLNTFLMIQDPVSTTVYLFTQKSFIKGEQN